MNKAGTRSSTRGVQVHSLRQLHPVQRHWLQLPFAVGVSGAFWHRGPLVYGPHSNAHASQRLSVGLGAQRSCTGILGQNRVPDTGEIGCTSARVRSLGPFAEESHLCPGPTTPYTASTPEWSHRHLGGQPLAPPGWTRKMGQIRHPGTGGIPGHLRAQVRPAHGSHQRVQGQQGEGAQE